MRNDRGTTIARTVSVNRNAEEHLLASDFAVHPTILMINSGNTSSSARSRSHRRCFGFQAFPLAIFLGLSCDATGVVEPFVEGSLAPPSISTPAIEESHEEPTAPPSSTSRREFHRPSWLDADHDCQTTRVEVLTAEARGPLKYEDERQCKVTHGRWRCPYTGEWIENPQELDVDHVVPLKNAWDSGASAWTEERWRQFANALEEDEHLVAVSAKANRSKGARGPDQWLPPLAEARCSYVRDWVAIKARWGLSATEAESLAIDQALVLCEAGKIPALPQEVKAEVQLAIPEPLPEDIADTCCKVCRKGKACGNTCIARDKTCSVGPGCACDG